MAQKERDMIEIDLLKLVLILWRKAWAIILAAIIMGGVAFGVTYNFIAPKYQASIKVYVNNTNQSSTTTLTQSDLNVAKQLVDTYIVTLKSRTTLNQIITEAGLEYDSDELNEMITAAAINSTEVFEVTVTSEDAKEAALIANTVADILPNRITEIVENSSVRIVDYAIINENPVSPSYVKNVAIGALAGIVIAVALIFLQLFLTLIRIQNRSITRKRKITIAVLLLQHKLILQVERRNKKWLRKENLIIQKTKPLLTESALRQKRLITF